MTTNKKQPLNHICLIRLSALGDCCHALAVIENIQRSSPKTKITWVIGKTEHQLFKDIKGVEFIVADKQKLFESFFKIKKELRGRCFDVLLNMHASMSANLISLAIKAKKKVGYNKDRARDLQSLFCNEYIRPIKNQHVVDGMLEFAKHINISNCPKWTPLILEPEEKFTLIHIDSNRATCLISPCSSQRYGDKYNRSWSIQNHITLIESLLKKDDIQIILTGGKSEIERIYSRNFDLRFGKKVLNLIGKTSIREMAALIKHADFLITPDSGPAHIGNIMGTPVIGLYAMLNPKRSGSYNSSKWSINKYPEALKKYMNKSPEEVKWGQKINNQDAMNLIKSKEVLDKIEELIEEKNINFEL